MVVCVSAMSAGPGTTEPSGRSGRWWTAALTCPSTPPAKSRARFVGSGCELVEERAAGAALPVNGAAGAEVCAGAEMTSVQLSTSTSRPGIVRPYTAS